jgi:hypothetical protein
MQVNPRGVFSMEAVQEPGIWQTLIHLFETLASLVVQLASLGLHWILWIVWGAWSLWGVNWKKTRHVLAIGGWAPVLLLMFLVALVWSRLDASVGPKFLPLPNFWWQLAYVGILGCIAMFCGWLQSVFHWTPHEINLDPPAHGDGHSHGHAHH